MRRSLVRRALVGASFLALPALATAQTTWTNWTAASAGATGSAAGTLGGVSVSWSGALNGFQLASGTSAGGVGNINYWTPAGPYTNAGVGLTAPDRLGFLQQNGAGSGTLTFSQAVVNPILAFISVGQPSVPVSYSFTSASGNPTLTLLSSNPAGNPAYWGSGSVTISGNGFEGREFSGVVQLNGTFTSINVAFAQNEFWHGFTVGQLNAQVVPEPSAYVLMATGLAALGAAARRRRVR
ncbi:MAG: PEP-CTERM sorting domain-containing protein [Gemmatimonadaceae bacterium]|jgi:hypothetical protein|nr:PEP-CTERM sorting domain-containing protein [Gemmatimonadaceae bacterium]